ncbi:hypothetical protein LHYA1_G009225 [Lachnellula hyalina]|uniref:Uncharacterized protein n=1 Tax=Lachnellula hyalina TaxID=1316788 RepID=A0A8H8TTV0_9HELO|nr:uncharacterized protein LHYA1_G009225 [Lachnellula hyalina]TVY22164.1 hypothetical protein LHYA1_G009225 [Lachnellula hyalina]
MLSNIKLIDIYSIIFFFTKVDDLIFYSIIHLISLALANNAFKALSLITSKRVFKYKDCLNRLIYAAGFKETLTSYYFQRGIANIINYNVLYMLTHISLICDPRAPVYISNNVLAALFLDPDITTLK